MDTSFLGRAWMMLFDLVLDSLVWISSESFPPLISKRAHTAGDASLDRWICAQICSGTFVDVAVIRWWTLRGRRWRAPRGWRHQLGSGGPKLLRGFGPSHRGQLKGINSTRYRQGCDPHMNKTRAGRKVFRILTHLANLAGTEAVC